MRSIPTILILVALTGPAAAFDLAFEWGNIPLCTTGQPNIVSSPLFTLGGLPEGTAAIRFKLTDLNVPSFDHGGGDVAYKGGDIVPAGAFQYRSPCPPRGSHTYEWRATAVDGAGNALDTGTASRPYP